MRTKIALLIILFLMVGFFAACKPSESVAPEIIPGIQDNGKNLGWIDTNNLTQAITLLQRWIDDHPNKRITAISSDSTGAYGIQNGWLFIYYEDKK